MASAAREKTAVAKRDANAPALATMFEGDAGAGVNDPSREDFAIPFISVLQKMSPQCDEIEGASPGKLFNNVTQDLFDDLIIIPVAFEKVYNEYIPREQGGGFVASYDSKEAAIAEMQEGHDLIDTANHYILYRDPAGTWQQALLSCTSTKLKISRQWNTRLTMVKVNTPNGRITPPVFATMWSLSTVQQENKHGKFFNIAVEQAGFVEDEEVYQLAKDFRAAVQAGRGKVDYNQSDATAPTSEEQEGEADEPEF